jgi:hypothetical protein
MFLMTVRRDASVKSEAFDETLAASFSIRYSEKPCPETLVPLFDAAGVIISLCRSVSSQSTHQGSFSYIFCIETGTICSNM